MMNMEEKIIKTDFSQCPLHALEQTPRSVPISKCHCCVVDELSLTWKTRFTP